MRVYLINEVEAVPLEQEELARVGQLWWGEGGSCGEGLRDRKICCYREQAGRDVVSPRRSADTTEMRRAGGRAEGLEAPCALGEEQLCGPRRGSRAQGVAARLPGVRAGPSWDAQLDFRQAVSPPLPPQHLLQASGPGAILTVPP